MARSDGYAHVYISPHLDDAVLSCAGRMWRQAQAAGRVAVVTLFAGAPDPASSFSAYAQELHARWGQPIDAIEERQKEDQEALAFLGVEAVHWHYRDCIYRRTPEGNYAYASEEALWDQIHPAEADLIQELAGRIGALPLVSDTALYVPLAVGRHVDHLMARRAAEGCGRALIYYEDFPYAKDPESVEAVLAEGRWTSELVPLSPEGLEAKIAAIARYRSQISTFWVDRGHMAASVRAFAERTGGGSPAERYWRPIGSL